MLRRQGQAPRDATKVHNWPDKQSQVACHPRRQYNIATGKKKWRHGSIIDRDNPKNEGAFLLEWLAHHKSIGFDDILVLSNDCSDGNDTMLDRLQDMGELTHVRNDGPYDDRGIQFTALKIAETHPLVQSADWIVSMDIDEFVNIHVGDHTLGALYAALPDADAIAITWRLFGNNGIIEYRDRFITEQFIRAAPKVMHWPWRAFMIKTLYRNTGAYKKLGVHRPRSPDKELIKQMKWVSGSGEVLSNAYKT